MECIIMRTEQSQMALFKRKVFGQFRPKTLRLPLVRLNTPVEIHIVTMAEFHKSGSCAPLLWNCAAAAAGINRFAVYSVGIIILHLDKDCKKKITAPQASVQSAPGRADTRPAGSPALRTSSEAVERDGAVVPGLFDGLDDHVVAVTVAHLNVGTVPRPFPQHCLAHRGLLADEAVKGVLPHGGDHLEDLGPVVLLQVCLLYTSDAADD